MRLELNHSAIEDLLKSKAVQDDLKDRAERIAQAAGPGHRVEVEVGHRRARAAVITESFGAMYREATDRSLTAAVDAGR